MGTTDRGVRDENMVDGLLMRARNEPALEQQLGALADPLPAADLKVVA